MQESSSRLRSFIAAAVVVGFCSTILPPIPLAHATAAWLAGWSYRKAITIDNTGMTATLTNFPLYVLLDPAGAGANLGNKILDSGYDIRFTSSDGTTLLPYERELYSEASGNSTGSFWVGITLNADNNAATNDTIYVYYGKAGAADGEDTDNGTSDVWDDNFKGVWHLGETGAGGAADYKDSTSNANDSTNTTNQPSVTSSGIAGSAQTLNGSKYVQLGVSNFPATNAAQTLSVWTSYTSTPATTQNVFTSVGASNSVQIGFRDGVPLAWKYGGLVLASASAAPTANAWHQYVFVTNGTNHTLYIDGVSAGTGNAALLSGSPTTGYLGTWDGLGEEIFAGTMDEARIAAASRSAGWVAFEYANISESDHQLAFASEENAVGNWSYRKKITIDHTNVDATLTNFPLLVRIHQDANIGAAAQNDGDDIRFTASDGITVLPYEREDFSVSSGSGSGNFWVKVPSISSTADTTVYLYYGKADATNGQDVTNVWDSNYVGVWHLSGSTLSVRDSTSNANATTNSGASAITGKVNGAASFNGSSDAVSVANVAAINPAQFTVDFWVNTPARSTSWQCFVAKEIWATSKGWLIYRRENDDLIAFTRGGSDYDILTAITNGWHHIVGTYNGTTMKLWVDGSSAGQSTQTLATSTVPMLFGSRHGNAGTGTSDYHAGLLDEIRFSNAVRSDAWIKFEYENMGGADNEISWGLEQNVASGLSASSTTLTSSDTTTLVGDTVALTATVSPASATGTVSFKNAGATIGTATLGHGSGSLSITDFTAGTHSLTAVYGGNGYFESSTSDAVIQTVGAASSSSSEATSTASTASESDTTTGGRRGSTVKMQSRIQTAYSAILSRFEIAKERQISSAATSPSQITIVQAIGGNGSGTTLSSAFSSSSSSTRPLQIVQNRNHLVALIDEQSILFRDVPLDAWFSPYVSYVIGEKIAEGYRDHMGKPKGEFGVVNPVTYAEILKMALEAAGTDLKGVPPPRNNTAQNTWASPYVAKAEALQLSVFRPALDVNAPATRGAVIQTVLEALGITIGKTFATYEDVPQDHSFSAAIASATFFGLIEGDKDANGALLNRFRPDDAINRAEAAKIIALAKEIAHLQ